MKLFDFRPFPQRLNDRSDRPKVLHYWPIHVAIGEVDTALITWEAWPENGSQMYPDATFTDYGWTLHLGPLKLLFGKQKVKR